jgi:hypothetical protein
LTNTAAGARTVPTDEPGPIVGSAQEGLRDTLKHDIAERTPDGCEVDVIDAAAPGGGYPLPLRLDLRSHSPTGYVELAVILS